MKLLSTLFLAIVNVWMVVAIPTKEQTNGSFNFWITGVSSGECDIVSLGPKLENAPDIVIPPYFIVEGEKYYVRNINHGALVGDFESVTFGSYLKKPIHVYDSGISSKNLKKIVIESKSVTFDSNGISGPKDIIFDGVGVPAMVKNLCYDLLVKQWKLAYNTRYANTESGRAETKTLLFKLAINMNKTFRKTGSDSSVLSALQFHQTTQRGMARLFVNLAINMGVVNEKEVFVAGDNHCGFWNYVKVGDEWYNVDVYNYDFTKNSSPKHYDDFFYSNSRYSQFMVSYVNHMFTSDIHEQPYRWVAYRERYGNESEESAEKINFDRFIITDGLGGHRV